MSVMMIFPNVVPLHFGRRSTPNRQPNVEFAGLPFELSQRIDRVRSEHAVLVLDELNTHRLFTNLPA